MQLKSSIQNIFVQLTDTLQQLNNEQYTSPCAVLMNATIGQHVRHIIELFQGLENGYENGVVNYEKRKRDIRIESDRMVATQMMHDIYNRIDRADKALILEANYDEHTETHLHIHTNYYRELVYNLEHAVHHMALIRVGLGVVTDIQVPEGFGVATSTIKYRNQCAQ